MPDIFHSFIINAPLKNVFEGISISKGLDSCWSKSSEVSVAIKYYTTGNQHIKNIIVNIRG